MRQIIPAIVLLLLSCVSAQAQDSVNVAVAKASPGSNKFAVYGNAEASYISNSAAKGFGEINFKPIFLWRISPRLFIEAEMEIETGGGSADLGLEYANMCYTVNPYLTLHAGRFLPKFGAYRGRLAEGFINRFSSNPTGFGDGGIGASVETGVGALGALPFGDIKILYDCYVVNGPHLLTDTLNAGQFDYEAYTANNNSLAVGGRIAIVPLAASNLELGFSFQHKAKTGDAGTENENVSLDMQAVDLNWYQNISALQSTLRITGELRHQKTGANAAYLAADGVTKYLFANSPRAWYLSGSLRPALVDNTFFRNLEFAYRYSNYKRPVNAPWGGAAVTSNEFAVDYWLHWNSLIKLAYQSKSDEPKTFYASVVFGF
ncbi:MAG: hypothetical protein JWR61_4144 [Ferruginibacter sp.]|uniref:hypothetical protein n=1 Tax=Ferruginibacter sp. TaxID=1940288 RepID=UPI002659D4F7|nr:hypothetical protein [Ferruginibacter sp.]MDB5279189.1 hypothetical protein [Ferruginibacter sp.]